MRNLVGSIVCICAILAGCTTRAKAVVAANDRYVGTQADDFFRERGMPARSTQLTDGNTLYEWRSDARASGEPLSTPTCVLQIEADKGGKIVSLRVTRDTIGMWKTSRCSEVLR